MLKKLDPLLHNELRLAIVSLLVKEGKANFTEIKASTNATPPETTQDSDGTAPVL
jgi:DNA-binding transcriptional ArsR family regulator